MPGHSTDLTASRGAPMGSIRRSAWWAVVAVSLAAAVGCRGRTAPTARGGGELRQMLADPDPTVRGQGALGLSQKPEEAAAAVPALVGLMKDADANVRQSAASAP